KGTTLTKEMFLNHLYGGMYELELKSIDVLIFKLRKKFSVSTGGMNYIETVWRRGYVLRESDERDHFDENVALCSRAQACIHAPRDRSRGAFASPAVETPELRSLSGQWRRPEAAHHQRRQPDDPHSHHYGSHAHDHVRSCTGSAGQYRDRQRDGDVL